MQLIYFIFPRLKNGIKDIRIKVNQDNGALNIDFKIDAQDLFRKMIKTISPIETYQTPSIIEVAFLISEKSINFCTELFEISCEELIPQFKERLDKLFQQYKSNILRN
jgi:hypothetical protein